MTAVQVSPQRLLLSGWLLTNVQVNITTTIHDIGHMNIHHTSIAIHILLPFTHLPFSWAGWLSSIPFVRYTYEANMPLSVSFTGKKATIKTCSITKLKS
jgi:hypothetical protein